MANRHRQWWFAWPAFCVAQTAAGSEYGLNQSAVMYVPQALRVALNPLPNPGDFDAPIDLGCNTGARGVWCLGNTA